MDALSAVRHHHARLRAADVRASGGNRGDDGAVAPKPWAAALQLDGSYPDQALGKVIPYRVQQLPLGMGLMYAAGLISALLGIGSGVLKIPAMDSALRLPT